MSMNEKGTPFPTGIFKDRAFLHEVERALREMECVSVSSYSRCRLAVPRSKSPSLEERMRIKKRAIVKFHGARAASPKRH